MLKQRKSLTFLLLCSVICFVVFGLISPASAETLLVTLDPVEYSANTYAQANVILVVDVPVYDPETGDYVYYPQEIFEESMQGGADIATAVAVATEMGASAHTQVTSQVTLTQENATTCLKLHGWISDTYADGCATHVGSASAEYSGNITIGTSDAFPVGTDLTLLVSIMCHGEADTEYEIGSQSYDLYGQNNYLSFELPVQAGEDIPVYFSIEGYNLVGGFSDDFYSTVSFTAMVPEPSALIMLSALLSLSFLWKKRGY